MSKNELDMLIKAYGPIITKLIDDNRTFYRFNETIEWCFGRDENERTIATFNRKTKIITINLKSFMTFYCDNDLRTIEYYLLHEIRHFSKIQ